MKSIIKNTRQVRSRGDKVCLTILYSVLMLNFLNTKKVHNNLGHRYGKLWGYVENYCFLLKCKQRNCKVLNVNLKNVKT